MFSKKTIKDIDVKGNHIGLRYDGDAEFKHYSLDQVQEIRIGTKRHWLAGAGIGAGVGGLAMGLGFGLGAKCSSTSDSDCKGLHALGTVFVSIAGAVAGFGIGAGIGSAIPRKKDKSNIVVTPQVYTHGGMSVHGGGLGVSGSF